MFDVVLPFQGRDVGSTQSAAAIEAQQVKSAEIVGLTQRILACAFFVINREKLRSYNLSAVLDTIISFAFPDAC